jgi:uncharacterized membrane-anchored protein
MQSSPLRLLLAASAFALVALRAPAQDPGDAALKARFEQFQKTMKEGPTTGQLGSVAKIEVPEGLAFTGKSGTTMFLELNQNIPSGQEIGLVAPADYSWFVVFEYEASGHVKDDDKDALDADKLLETIRDGTEEGNKERKRRGWSTMEVVGWHKAPFYDPTTHNLTWSIHGRSSNGDTINWSTRLLGRTGIVRVDLVADPANIEAAIPKLDELLKGFDYVAGQTYGEFKPGDKIAEYGLAALVAGGAGALAVKTGLIAKFWKLIVGAFVAVGAFIKKLFGFGKKSDASGN